MKKLSYLIGLTLLSNCALVGCKKDNETKPHVLTQAEVQAEFNGYGDVFGGDDSIPNTSQPVKFHPQNIQYKGK